MAGVNTKGDQGLGAGDTRQSADMFGDNVCELIIVGRADHYGKIIAARDRINFTHAFGVGKRFRNSLGLVSFGCEQNDSR